MNTWQEAQQWEKAWHGNCINKLSGELNQVKNIAPKLGLKRITIGDNPYFFDVQGKSVLDIGGGSASILLKCVNFTKAKVVDPITFPQWTYARYQCAGIETETIKGEDITDTGFDEVWLYNCLQHCENPEQVVFKARQAGKLVRVYEYINVPVCPGHIHTLTRENLDKWFGGSGKVEGKYRYYGIFPSNINTRHYWNTLYRKEGIDTWRVKQELNDFVLANITGSVLELGCGVGVLARQIKDTYLGLDISDEAVKLMREQGFNAEVRDLPPINTNKFNTIVGLEILEHLDDREAVIKEASRLCDRAIFSVPNNRMSPSELNEHRVVFTEESFKAFLLTAFKKVAITKIKEYLVAVCE